MCSRMRMANAEKNNNTDAVMETIPKHFNPRSLDSVKFAKARSNEIRAIQQDLARVRTNRSALGLPNHMRRRAMSHNVKRFPHRLRRIAEEKMNNSLANANKKTLAKNASRHHRRRPKNLREEFARRQNDKVWLETHLWHAKRFKMIQQWNYKLPLHPCDKSVRAAYRSTVKHCTIQDVSFNEVIEMRGKQTDIVDCLGQLTCPETGLTVGAQMFSSGQHYGELTLYHKASFPYGAISKVQFLWRCISTTSSSTDADRAEKSRETSSQDTSESESIPRTLWVWVHPSAFLEVLAAINSVVKKELVEVKDLRGELVRFRLSGPQANAVVTDGLKVSTLPEPAKEEDTIEWWQRKLADTNHFQTVHEQQTQFWNQLTSIQSVTELPSRCAIGLIVRDPRILLPIRRKKVETDHLKADFSTVPRCPRPGLNESASYIWDQDVRDGLSTTMQSTHNINELRRNILVPGVQLDLGSKESRVPVLLLQSPGVQLQVRSASSGETPPLGFGSGWDVVIPKKWGTIFWVGFIFRGARAVGLKDSYNRCLHQGLPRIPEDFPDTRSGQEIEELMAKELEATFKRKPPAKRPNYAKLGFLSPFRCPWEKLVSEWMSKQDGTETDNGGINSGTTVGTDTNEPFYVLRHKSDLRKLQSVFHDITSHTSHPAKLDVPPSVVTTRPSLQDLNKLDKRGLVWVRVDLLQRGSPEAFSMICLPKECDLVALKGGQSRPEPVESLKKQFKLDKKTKKGKPTPTNEETFDEKVAKAKLLELNSRTIIGFVTNGSHAFSRGKGHAVGFCCLPGLLVLAESSNVHVLVRDSKSTQYRFARVTVLL